MQTCGINIGASSVKVAVLENGTLIHSEVRTHDGDVHKTVTAILTHKNIPEGIITLAAANNGLTALRLKGVIEAVAIQAMLQQGEYTCRALVSMGGEDLVVFAVNEEGRIINSFSGNKCASGTGEFFKQQLKRMDLEVAEGIDIAGACTVHKISSRCSVFMKSDCTHKLNKGEAAKGDIVLSLSNVMAEKVVEFLKKAKITSGTVLLTGGLTRNPHLIRFLANAMPDVTFDIPATAACFEAYGAALLAQTQGEPLPDVRQLFHDEHVSYEKLPPLTDFASRVHYVQPRHGKVQRGRTYILGIDGGSTTTKVALIDYETEEIVATFYGRTHGDPVHALKNCLEEIKKEILDEIGSLDISIVVAATTGSSREILGVFMETAGIYNEIIAHTVGTTYFDKHIDTIFEIGGQDAKYVFIKNNVPIDYAMNEACSAGTGSFLEESAKGDLAVVSASEIGDLAEKATSPIKFGEHCSAFINSDLRKAIQEGAGRYNIVAGLVYSIVHNYLNRVVGNRTVGNRVVLQGGVAKNSAVPLAFAALTGKDIVVPPDPELMGCFGVGILAKRKISEGLLQQTGYHLHEVLKREIVSDGEFICRACDNRCTIKRLKVGAHSYSFGGRCNKFANNRKSGLSDATQTADLVQRRHELLFKEFGAVPESGAPGKQLVVGIPQAFSVYSLWPLYSHFFKSLGVRWILSETIDHEGLEKMNAPFCYPGEIAHGMMVELIEQKCDFYFLPHFKDYESLQDDVHACLCPIMQGLPYYLRTAFRIPPEKILAPVVSFGDGLDAGAPPFVELARQLGFSGTAGQTAYEKGLEAYRGYLQAAREEGSRAIARVERENKTAIVLFGRPYNALTSYANMGIPKKFTSRGYTVIPFDFIPFDGADIYENMYWHYGQQNLRAAVNTARHKNLYLCYISNFSCAPDSFILHYLRWIHGAKPFLVLELDSHTADAGVDTRIEALLDIIEGYQQGGSFKTGTQFSSRYEARITTGGMHIHDNATSAQIEMRDQRVKFLLPNMGSEGTQASAAICRRYGIDTEDLPVSDRNTVQLAQNIASGKECIPCLIVLGSFIQYFQRHGVDPDRIYVLLTPITTGPCRTGQYAVFYDRILREVGYENIVLLRLSSDNSYNELGPGISRLVWRAICVGDALKDLKSGIRVCLSDPEAGFRIVDEAWSKLLVIFEKGDLDKELLAGLRDMARQLAALPRLREVDEVKKILIVGEIFVRRDDFSVSPLVDRLTEWGILTRISGLTEWIHYMDYARKHRFRQRSAGKKFFPKAFSSYYLQRAMMKIEFAWKRSKQHKIEAAIRESGLFPTAPSDMKAIMKRVPDFTSMDFESEATLSPAVAAEAMQNGYSGIVVISPFACLPGRLIEAIYAPWAHERNFPVLALENDGSEYPPNMISKINIFCLNVASFNKNDA
jgi:predicted CoA-substrate-specific enzyme activase